jgi:hypothetical protein
LLSLSGKIKLIQQIVRLIFRDAEKISNPRCTVQECLGFAPDAELHVYRVFTNSQVQGWKKPGFLMSYLFIKNLFQREVLFSLKIKNLKQPKKTQQTKHFSGFFMWVILGGLFWVGFLLPTLARCPTPPGSWTPSTTPS